MTENLDLKRRVSELEDLLPFASEPANLRQRDLEGDGDDAQERFFLDRDGDSHWYLVPEKNRAEWEAWFNLPEDDEDSWEAPAFAQRIGRGAATVTFTNPEWPK